MDILSKKIQIAKKDHKCDFCSGKILKGEKYENTAIKGDEFYVWKSHLRCKEIAAELNMYDNCDEGVTAEDFYEYIHNEFLEMQGDMEDFKIPEFQKQLDAVCRNHNI